jgi:hypothetical protein
MLWRVRCRLQQGAARCSIVGKCSTEWYLDGSLVDPRQLLLILPVYGSATMLTQQEVAWIIHGVATWLVDFCLFWRGLTLRACDDAVYVVIW